MATKCNGAVSIVSPRETVQIHLNSGQVLEGPRGCEIGQFLKIIKEPEDPPIVGAVVNGVLRELTYKIEMDSRVTPVTMGEADGMRIYRRSLIFLLDTAFDRMFPQAELHVDHSIASGGYYCSVEGRQTLSNDELQALEKSIRTMVEEDLPFKRDEVPLTEAIQYFTDEAELDKVRLLSHRKKNYLTMYELDGHFDYHHGYMVPSTGYLQWFSLEPMEYGFTLRFPKQNQPTKLSQFKKYPKLLATFRRYRKWLSLLGISSVGALNDAIIKDKIHEVILVSEALHEQRITEISSFIHSQRDKIRVVIVAGPSASGKTTFSKRLSIQLLAHGIAPFPLEMDKYFVDREKTPRNENGELDFESIHAIDCARLSHDLQHLIAGEKVQLPSFDFITGKSVPGEEVQLSSNEIIILEGIHGLNPELITNFPSRQAFRIYVSALTQLNLDRHNRISTTDNRLLRRIVRDVRDRGYSAYDTIQRWESVRNGERNNIFPYQEFADVMFNSALSYEMSALKSMAEPILRQVPFGTPEYIEAKRLLAFLGWFLPLDIELIPDNSIIREFIGNSILKDFSLWGNH
jgi:uridine kinase